MTKPRTLRCPRHLGMILAGVAVAALCDVVATQKALDGAGAPALAAGAACFALALGVVPQLRTRMILDAEGLTLVSGYGRRRFAWTEIIEISADAHQGFWLLQVRSEDRERQAAFFPVRFASMPVDQGTRFREPSGDTPYGLYRLHAELRERWQSHAPRPEPPRRAGSR
ncbi:PH domain-containing protein [Spirillospora sp. CA-108201]